MEKQLAMTSSSNARYVLFVLLAVYVNNMWARYLLVYLYAVSDENYDDDDTKQYVSITDATGISTSEYGILVGYGFSFCYVVFGLVMGRAADVYNRKKIIFYGTLIWNVATVWLGLSNNYSQLLQSRILLGIGESFSMPASFSMIADYFPVDSLAQANGIYTAGIYVGGGLSSMSIAIAESIGWRGSAFSVATAGFLLAFLLRFTVKEPVRAPSATPSAAADGGEFQKIGQGARNPEEDQSYTVKQSLVLVFGEPLFLLMILGGMVRLMGAFTLASYLPDFYGQVYPDYNTVYSYLNASVVSVGGALSSYLGGYAADRWEKAGEKRARLYIPAIGALLGAPAFFMVVVIPSFYASMFFLFVEFLLAECWYGPLISILQKFLPPRARGVGIGCYSFCIIVAGSSMTYALGLILDSYTSDTAIKRTLIVGVCGMYLASAIIYLIASRFMPELNSGPLNGSERQPLLNKGYDELEADSYEVDSRSNNNGAARSRSIVRDPMY